MKAAGFGCEGDALVMVRARVWSSPVGLECPRAGSMEDWQRAAILGTDGKTARVPVNDVDSRRRPCMTLAGMDWEQEAPKLRQRDNAHR